MPHQFPKTRFPVGLVMGLAWLAVIGAAAPADAQSPAVRYERALAREKAARAAAAPTPATLRTIARYYEGIVRAYPRSGYSDNALWQAAGLMALAHERTGAASDLASARRLLAWLKREYPTAALARQVDGRLAALRSPAKPARPAPSAPAPAPPAPVAAAEPPAAPPTPAPRVDVVTSAPVAPITPAPPDTSRPAGNVIRNITHAALPRGDRITVELGRETLYTTSRAERPDRVLVEFSDAAVAADLARRAAVISGTLIRSLSVARAAGDDSRVVLELDGAPRLSTFPLYNPFRLVIDIESDAAETAAATPPPTRVAAARAPAAPPAAASTSPAPAAPPAAAPPAPSPVSPASTSRGDYSLARQLGLSVSRIVLDPGHGGHDPGARANGVNEASIVLDVALRVEKLLNAQPGFEVVLTRRTDVFIPLEERTAIANREQADMFLSIHVNSSPRPATRGVETYLLDFATTPDAEAIAARENASSAQTMRLLPEIVKTITLTNKLDESRELARMVQTSLVGRLSPLSKGLKDLGVKRAPFVVLIGAQMPSVLAEISFLTNRTDAALLKQASHRQRIAQALADAIVKYRASLKGAPAPTAQTATR